MPGHMRFWRKRKEDRVCPNCKNPIPTGLAFCDSCGFRVIPPPVCQNCRTPLAPGTNFCENCGTPAGATPEAQPESPPDELNVTGDEEGIPETPGPEIEGPSPDVVPEVRWPVVAAPGISFPQPVSDPLPDPIPVPTGHVLVQKRTLIFAGAGLFCLIVALAVLFLGAGCGDGRITPDLSPAATPVPATMMQGEVLMTETIPTADAAIAGPPLVPGRVLVPPESLRIWLQADRDPITHIVTVIYNGGKGERAVRDVTVRLTRSDGRVLQETFRPVTIGEGVEMQGTKYADRLEVIVTYNSGDTMTVIDRIFPYHERN